jgi:HK97 family phage prohead protease/HK97 family phage major capsid protein
MTNKTFYLNSSFEAKALSKGSNSIKIAGYANTTSKDRAGDVVTAEAWAKGVENFRQNPVMLYQHKHDCPIGRFDKITVDKKGIYVEGTVSEAAEKNHGIHTLIKDGALKSFSVGFRVKNGKYNSADDTMLITDVELLEISVVSVPCNQESLFSLRKSFDTTEDYSSFIKSFDEASVEEVKMMQGIKAGITDICEGHYHTIEIDDSGNGVTTYASHMQNHAHRIIAGIVQEADGHSHSISMLGVPAVSPQDADIVSERPLSPSEEEVMGSKSIEDVEFKATEESEEIEEEATFIDPNERIPFINLLSADTSTIKVGALINYKEKIYKVAEIPTAQSPIFKFLEVDANGEPCDNTLNVNAEEISQLNKLTKTISEDTKSTETVVELLHEDSTKENDKMAEQVVETIDLSSAKATQVENTKSVTSVSAPRVADLVEKTGEAILQHADAQEKRGEYTPSESEQLSEMKAQLNKYRDEIKAMQNSKMLYNENSRSSSQFSEKEMANAVLLAKILNKRDIFDTRLGSRMKAVSTTDRFMENFSSNIYTEMETQLVIAPMFNRLPVDAKIFRVPVADEDATGDIAMFKSGSYATGIADTTNVPNATQNTITSVDFTPHKFMASTFLAKDEEEDTVLPLIDFLRSAATRRLARAIDKSILRGTGALTGFTAAPSATIATGGSGFPSVITGITALANAVAASALITKTGGVSTKATPSNIASARTIMGKYGLQLGNDLVYITSIEGYNELVTTADFRTVDKFGPNATYLTGSVGAVYGIPIVISEFIDNVGVSGNVVGSLVYKPGFMIAERRGIEIESEYEPRQQVTAMYMSTRIDFKALTTVASAALSAARYAYAVNVTSAV